MKRQDYIEVFARLLNKHQRGQRNEGHQRDRENFGQEGKKESFVSPHYFQILIESDKRPYVAKQVKN